MVNLRRTLCSPAQTQTTKEAYMAGSSRDAGSMAGPSSLDIRLNRRKFLRTAATVGAAGVARGVAQCLWFVIEHDGAGDDCGNQGPCGGERRSGDKCCPGGDYVPRQPLPRAHRRWQRPVRRARRRRVRWRVMPLPPAGTVTIPLISNPTPNPIVLPGGLSSILLDKNLFGQLVRPDANARRSRHPISPRSGIFPRMARRTRSRCARA